MGRKSMKIFLAPHNDDEVLFGAYTLLSAKPLVIICTDSYIQLDRGDNVTKEERIEETKKAMDILGIDVEFLHIPDNQITEELLEEKLKNYKADIVFAPAIEDGGNPIHNMVGKIAKKLFNTRHYMTYTKDNTKTKGSIMIYPNEEEKELKQKALSCYPSQMKISTTRPFFDNKNVIEWESYE